MTGLSLEGAARLAGEPVSASAVADAPLAYPFKRRASGTAAFPSGQRVLLLRVVGCLPLSGEVTGHENAGGQASHKPRGRKPREGPMWLSGLTDYGDLTVLRWSNTDEPAWNRAAMVRGMLGGRDAMLNVRVAWAQKTQGFQGLAKPSLIRSGYPKAATEWVHRPMPVVMQRLVLEVARGSVADAGGRR
jgi:hypothetical protein